jgi:hypothetical protein
MKSALKIISCDRRDIALAPAPIVFVRLIYPNESNGDGQDRHRNYEARGPGHGSALDKAS